MIHSVGMSIKHFDEVSLTQYNIDFALEIVVQ